MDGDEHAAPGRERVGHRSRVAHRNRQVELGVAHAEQQRRALVADRAVENRAGEDVGAARAARAVKSCDAVSSSRPALKLV